MHSEIRRHCKRSEAIQIYHPPPEGDFSAPVIAGLTHNPLFWKRF